MAPTTLASFNFLGLIVPVDLKYDAASNAELTMQNGGSGDAGDIYTGLDRRGRLDETIGKTASAELVPTTCGRNRIGGVTWQPDDDTKPLIVKCGGSEFAAWIPTGKFVCMQFT